VGGELDAAVVAASHGEPPVALERWPEAGQELGVAQGLEVPGVIGRRDCPGHVILGGLELAVDEDGLAVVVE
jgi:hypothetical protein